MKRKKGFERKNGYESDYTFFGLKDCVILAKFNNWFVIKQTKNNVITLERLISAHCIFSNDKDYWIEYFNSKVWFKNKEVNDFNSAFDFYESCKKPYLT